jgi:hypothetical protein
LSESDKDKSEGTGGAGAFLLDRRAAGMFVTICAGLTQGIVVYLMSESSLRWHWYITASLLPLPFYMAKGTSKRALLALILWAAILMLLDGGQVLFGNPYVRWRGDFAFIAIAYIGALLTLPNFVSWIDGDGAFPEWQTSFRHFSRMLFAAVIAVFFLLLFSGVLAISAGLAGIIGGGFRYIGRWFSRCFVILACAAWGAAFRWSAGAARLSEVFERYVLTLFSSLLPFLSVFTLVFVAALPLGIERLWRRGFDSGVVLSIFLVSGLCAFAGWQGGVGDDGRPREPFFRPVNILVKAALVALPIFCPLLVYTIGLRVGQYGWTTDRVIGIVLAVSFGLWSLAWAFFLVRRWETWPIFYGRVNRIAFPTVGIALILIASPLCDARRMVVYKRLEWLRESIRAGKYTDDFDWRYVARELGIYGVDALEALAMSGGAGFNERFGPFGNDSQAEKIRDKMTAALDSVKKEKESLGRPADLSGTNRRAASEDFMLNARTAPVFGGELSPDDRERLARLLPEKLVVSRANYGGGGIGFFYLADMNGDGGKEVLLGLRDDIYLLAGGRAFLLRRGTVTRKNGLNADNKTVISNDEQRVIRNQWGMLQLNDRVFFVDPSDAREIESNPRPFSPHPQ